MTETQCELEQSQDGFSTCQCTTTLHGEKKETKTCVLRSPKEDLRTDIGSFLGLDKRRNGTELMRTNRMENGIVSLRT